MLKQLRPFFLLLGLITCSGANATNFAERESLARILHELDSVMALANEAQSHANPDSRIRFQYQLLKKDLAKIRLGIKEHLDSPTIEPREYAPLSGDYRR